MGIFDLCCQPKAKKSLDYVLKWIDSASVTLNELSASVLSLQRWQDEIDDDIAAKIDDGIKQYDWSKVIPSLDNYCEKAVPALQDYIAVLNTDGSIKMGSNKISDLALANHTHSVGGFDNLDHMFYYLENNGVIFGERYSSTLAFHLSKNSESQYIIDTSASGEIISRLGQSAVSGIFTPVRVKFDDEYHIGYYWTYQGAKSLHVAGLVFEYDNVSGEWEPARACLINDGTIPQWRKVETINLNNQHYDNTTITLNDLENYNTYYVGAIIRIVSAGGDRPGEIAGRGRVLSKETGPNRIITSIDHSDFTSTYRTPNFDIYILDNSDTVLPYDSAPTSGSNKLITSGGVHKAISEIPSLSVFPGAFKLQDGSIILECDEEEVYGWLNNYVGKPSSICSVCIDYDNQRPITDLTTLATLSTHYSSETEYETIEFWFVMGVHIINGSVEHVYNGDIYRISTLIMSSPLLPNT